MTDGRDRPSRCTFRGGVLQYFGFDPFNSSSGPPDTWPPSMVNLASSYDHQGRVSGMTDGTATWVQGVTYDLANRMTSLQYPQNSSTFGYMTEAKTFNTNGQLASMTWTPSGSGSGLPSGTISYAYTSTTHTGNNGQVASTTDGVSGETIVYNYDVLKRLTSASSSPTSGTTPRAWSQSYSYDGFGNLTSKGTGLTIPVNSSTNQLMNEAISGVNILSNVSYDSNGNLLSVTNGSGPELTMTYDGSNRVLTAAVGTSGTEHYGYDANNRRIYRRLTSGNEEWTLYGGNGENLGTFQFYEQCEDPDDPGDCWWEPLTLSTNIWFGSKLIWSGTGSWSGSTTVFADRNGTNRASGARFYPYGDEITSTGNDRVKFATYRRSSFTGLDYAEQRYYASVYGRFTSVDGGAVSTKDPVTWNRYTYTGGDPINRSDPRGTCWGNNSDGQNQVMEDWDWDYGEQWTDPGWVHTMGGCYSGPEYDEALATCGEGVDWSPDGYSCIGPIAAPVQPPAPDDCPLVAIVGNYTTKSGVTALFAPDMADLIDKALAILNGEGITPVITDGFRTDAGQASVQGSPNGSAPVGQSWHEVGEAVDIRYYVPGTKTPLSYASQIVAAMTSVGLTWGGTFSNPPDVVHFQDAAKGTHPNPTQVENCRTEHP